MVTQYGMSKKFGLIGLETVENQYLDGRTSLNCSDVTAADVDTEVMTILKDSYSEALRLLSENRAILDKIADFLIEKETITGKEFMQIYRAEKGIPEPVEKQKEVTESDTSVEPQETLIPPEDATPCVTEEPQEAAPVETDRKQDEDKTVSEPENDFASALRNRVYHKTQDQ